MHEDASARRRAHFLARAKYIYLGRDGRDMLLRLYNHHAHANDIWYGIINDTPGRVGPPIGRPSGSIRDYFTRWLDEDGFPFWSLWENVRSWRDSRDLPNVKLIHFADLKADLPGSIRDIAEFLGIFPSGAMLERVVGHCTFDYMKANAEKMAPLGGIAWSGGAQTFIHKGENGRWRDTLKNTDVAAYEARALAELSPDRAAWLARGSRRRSDLS